MEGFAVSDGILEGSIEILGVCDGSRDKEGILEGCTETLGILEGFDVSDGIFEGTELGTELYSVCLYTRTIPSKSPVLLDA